MLHYPLITKIDSTSEDDLEIAATLIEALCFHNEVASQGLINSAIASNLINIYLNGTKVELLKLISIFEDESINFIAIPPINYSDYEFASLFLEYETYRSILCTSDSPNNLGIVQLKSNYMDQGIGFNNSLISIENNSCHAYIMNLGKDFHFITNSESLGNLHIINLVNNQ